MLKLEKLRPERGRNMFKVTQHPPVPNSPANELLGELGELLSREHSEDSVFP